MSALTPHIGFWISGQLVVVERCTEVLDVAVTPVKLVTAAVVTEGLRDDAELALALSVDFIVVDSCSVLLARSAGK
jgi:hypothetical protein